MGVFEEVKLTWRGEEKIIPPDRVMGAIAVAENHITLKEISEQLSTGNAKITQVVLAFTRVLRYAGFEDVDKDDVYAEMFNRDDKNNSFREQAALTFLLGLMVPPQEMRKAMAASEKQETKVNGGEPPVGKTEPTVTAEKPSRKRTK